MGRLFQYAVGLSDQEATFSRRGFHNGDPVLRSRLESAGRTFISGYNAALSVSKIAALERRLEHIEEELRGFAFEGAATALAILDHLTPWNRTRLRSFIAGPAAIHIYMVHIGAGWAIARLPWLQRSVEKCLSQFDPLLRWLLIDGFGFEQGFFQWRKTISEQKYPAPLTGYARRVFDQGLGRSLWFVDGADVFRISNTIACFPANRHRDLWSGVGLACAYAGGADAAALEILRTAAGNFVPHMAQGAAFAAKARQRAGNPAVHTEMACRFLCGLSAEAAARVTDEALKYLPGDEIKEPAYETWRRTIQAQLTAEKLL